MSSCWGGAFSDALAFFDRVPAEVFAAGFLAAGSFVLAAGFFAAGFLVAVFFVPAADFFAAGFLAVAFFAAGFFAAAEPVAGVSAEVAVSFSVVLDVDFAMGLGIG
jgi:hypothetical protein